MKPKDLGEIIEELEDEIASLRERLAKSNKCLFQMQNANIDLIGQLKAAQEEGFMNGYRLAWVLFRPGQWGIDQVGNARMDFKQWTESREDEK